jgi:hypothetical protein
MPRVMSIMVYYIVNTSLRLMHNDTVRLSSHTMPVCHHLDPVTIRVEDERQSLHATLVRPLLEQHSELFEPLACGLDVVDSNSNVPEATAGLAVTACVTSKLRIVLGTVVMGELENT